MTPLELTASTNIPQDDPLERPQDDGGAHRLDAKTLSGFLPGVLVAVKLKDDPEAVPVQTWIARYFTTAASEDKGRVLSLAEWRKEAAENLPEGVPRTVANLLLGVSLLIKESRGTHLDAHNPTPSATVSLMWELIFGALNSGYLVHSSPSRSAQGFLSVNLCSIITDGKIDVLVRLHVWRSDGERGNADIAVHSHQPWTRSWILGGEATDHSYEYDVVPDALGVEPTHAMYRIEWDQSFGVSLVEKGEEVEDVAADHAVEILELETIDGIGEAGLAKAEDGEVVSVDESLLHAAEGKGYNTYQQWSTVYNTGILVNAREVRKERHTRDTSYTIRTEKYHYTEVARDELHATLFIFDAYYGFTQDAGIFGPINGRHNTQPRNPGGNTTIALARAADALRRFDIHLDEARRHTGRGDWEAARRAIGNAIHACSAPDSALLNEHRYLALALSELSTIIRRFGQDAHASGIYDELLSGLVVPESPSELCASIHGELGVLRRHAGNLEDAKTAFQTQYDMATAIGWERGVCRAVGNLGIVNYQLWESQEHASRDDALWNVAIAQLRTRVKLAQDLRKVKTPKKTGGGLNGKKPKRAPDWKRLHAWEAIGLSRLSVCCAARGNVEEALKTASDSLTPARESGDPTLVAICRFFYGRALVSAGRRAEALQEFNTQESCTPAMALCRVPSQEYHAYLEDLVADPELDLDIVDEQGNSALDYAIMSGNETAGRIILKSLARSIPTDGRLSYARLKRSYQELCQEFLRPVLLENKAERGLQRLRTAYAHALESDKSKAQQFDKFKFVPYRDLQKYGKLPRASEGSTLEFDPGKGGPGSHADYFIYFSYRWKCGPDGAPSPDDESNTQYRRILDATESFLALHPSVNPENLGIWIVST